jgi:hypothetical protein
MSDTSGYPVAQQPYDPNQPVAQAPAPAPMADATLNEYAMTPEETAAADTLYDELKPAATSAAREYVLARTKADWQEYMITKIEADWPAPPAGEDPLSIVRVQGEQGRVSVQKPAISDNSPQVALKGRKVDAARAELDTNIARA